MALKCKVLSRFFAFLLVTAVCTTPAMAAELPETLVPMGNAVGITVKTDGVLVADVSEVETEEGKRYPASDAGIYPGDVITNVNGQKITGLEELEKILDENAGKPLEVKVERTGETKAVEISPCKSKDGSYELGVWLRDSMTGLGTITFYDPESKLYGALGHPINDIDTGVLVPVRTGSIMQAAVSGVIRGEPGNPGQLQGAFDADSILGDVEENTVGGIFGELSEIKTAEAKEEIPVAEAEEIALGEVTVLSNVAGEQVERYTAEITRIYDGSDVNGRNMMISITDERLLDKTGGIVQGMSGSPIIQDGKLIGAVTHVLVNDPTRGYGIFIENMLDAAS